MELRAILVFGIWLWKTKRGPIRVNNKSQAEKDLILLKKEYSTYSDATIANKTNPLFKGETAEIFNR